MKKASSVSARMREKLQQRMIPQKSSIFTEDVSRGYDFIDTPFLWVPQTPLIQRQQLKHSQEIQLRQACKVLCEKIERGEKSIVPQEGPRRGRVLAESWPETQLVRGWTRGSLDRSVSEEATERANETARKGGIWDSRIARDGPKRAGIAEPIQDALDSSEDGSNYEESGSTTNSGRSSCDVANFPNTPPSDRILSGEAAVRLSVLPEIKDFSFMIDMLQDIDPDSGKDLQTINIPPKMETQSSNNLPKTSGHKVRGLNDLPVPSIPPAQPKEEQQTRTEAIPAEHSWGGLESYPGGLAVIIGADGMDHIMTATEEEGDRYMGFQSAVMKKSTSRSMAANPEYTPKADLSIPRHAPRPSLHSISETGSQLEGGSVGPLVVDDPPHKKSSVIRRLSDLGKRPSGSMRKIPGMTGLARVIEV